MQRLRQAADVVERRLGDLADLAQVGSQRRALRRVPAGAAQHRSHRRQHLAEFVVQLARDLAQRRLRARRSAAAPARAAGPTARRAARTAGGSSESDTGWSARSRRAWRRGTRRPGAEPGCRCPGRGPPSAPRLRCSRPSSRATAVLERRLPRLQRQPDLRARLGLLAACRQREDPIGGIPELRQRAVEVRALLGRPRATRRPPARCAARRRDRCGCAETAPTRPSADTARRCRACRASPGRAGSDRSGCEAAAASPSGCGRPGRSAARAGRRSAA